MLSTQWSARSLSFRFPGQRGSASSLPALVALKLPDIRAIGQRAPGCAVPSADSGNASGGGVGSNFALLAETNMLDRGLPHEPKPLIGQPWDTPEDEVCVRREC